MKQFCVVVCACGLLAGPTLASTLFTDGFESGVNSNWQVVAGTYNQNLVSDNAHAFGNGSARQVDADPWIYYSRTVADAYTANAIGAGEKQVLTAYMWDDDSFHNGHPTNQPVAAGVMFATANLEDFFQISVLSSGPGGYSTYNWRASGQGTFSTGVARSPGWHKFQIEVLPYTGTNDVNLYIDDVKVASGNRKVAGQNLGFSQIRLGISVKTYAPFWYDNVDVSMVPEPASLLLLGLGACVMLRRKA